MSKLIEEIHNESPDKGYRRIRDELERRHGIKANDKRVLRICRSRGVKSTVKYANNGCTKQAANPQYTAQNILNREFKADKPNEKWLTDVTEFKWYEGVCPAYGSSNQLSLSFRSVPSIAPAMRNRFTQRRKFLSATSRSRNFIGQSWSTLSKKPLMSDSKTQ
ncbi:MAG: IS3 family transposase [Clostridiales Family XIII bacterium]|nr:IS3 family transposase [Clostridiales Family XIII bacterium]